MEMLTQEVGWAASQNKLMWTNDDGRSWIDITPQTGTGKSIVSTYFINPSTGWLLLNGGSDNANEPIFELYSTSSAGAQWTCVQRVVVPDLDPTETALSGQGRSILWMQNTVG